MTKAGSVARWIVNFLIGGVWVLVFNTFGWITLSPQPHTLSDPTLGHLLDAALIGLLIGVAGEIGSILYVMFVVATLGLGCLLLPFYWLLIGYFKLWLASVLLPGWFVYTHNILFVIVMSWILGASRWPTAREVARRGAPARDAREVQAEWHEVDERRS